MAWMADKRSNTNFLISFLLFRNEYDPSNSRDRIQTDSNGGINSTVEGKNGHFNIEFLFHPNMETLTIDRAARVSKELLQLQLRPINKTKKVNQLFVEFFFPVSLLFV